MLWITRGLGATTAARYWFVFGLGFFGSLLSWISIVGWPAWGLAVTLQAGFFALFGACLSRVDLVRNRAVRIATSAALWVLVAEFLRSVVPFGGFTWGQLAQSQHDVSWLLRLAAWGGGWLISFVLVAVNALLVEAIIGLRARNRAVVVVMGALATVLLAGPLVLPTNSAEGASFEMAIVQGNVSDTAGPGETSFERELEITTSHADLTEDLQGRGMDLVVWPESAVGLDPEQNPQVLAEIRRAAVAVGAPLLVGGNQDVDDDRYAVMIYEVSPEGEIVDRYRKTHLVPFGEYIPGRRFLEWIPTLDQIPRDAIEGDEIKTFDVAGGTVGTVISFEGDFGPLVRTRIAAGARLLVVATNTSTWGRTWASAQHLSFSQIRAAENGTWVAHAAVSGISAFVAPDGRVTEASDLYKASSLVRRVRFATGTTFYARVGDWVPLVSLLLVAAAFLANRRERSVTQT